MRKITLLAALLIGCFAQAQISTGLIPITDTYTIGIEIDQDNVIIAMIGEENRWMGLGFGVSSMTAGG